MVRWQDLISDDALIAAPLGHGVTRLSEHIVSEAERSFFYLVEGRDFDVLIDGGWGFGRSIDRHRERPLHAIATHSHFDHIGLLHLATRRFGHQAEAAIFAGPTPHATQALPWLDGLACLADGNSIAAETIAQKPCPLTDMVADGATLALGNRVLSIIHTPGHSPGSLSVLDSLSGFLFCADTVHDGHIFDDIPRANRADLRLSHQRLADVEFVQACPGHGALLSPGAFRRRIEDFARAAGT